MATDERPEMQEDPTELALLESRELATLDVTETVAPKILTQEETQEIQTRATQLVAQLEEASGSQELELIDSMTNVGLQAQRNAGIELDLLRSRVGEMLTGEGPGAELSKDLVDLRMALNQINPNQLTDEGSAKKLFRMIPLIGKFNPAFKVLERIAIRYEPVSKQVSVIESRLREGRQMLTRANVEMRKLYEQIEVQQIPILKNAYLGELLMQQLGEVLEKIDDTLSGRKNAERPARCFHARTRPANHGGGAHPVFRQHRNDAAKQYAPGPVR